MAYSETGRPPLIVQRKYQVLKYWVKLIGSENCILKTVYEMTLRSCREHNIRNWLSEIREILISIGMVDVWQQQNVDNERFFFLMCCKAMSERSGISKDR